jgi:cytochrome c oxidase cbb3-type subunit 3
MSEYQHDQERGHSFDGITEYDNKLPNWWLLTLYLTIVFAFGYWLYYHTLGIGDLAGSDYQQEMETAAEMQLARMAGSEVTDASLELRATISARVTAGRALFEQYCVVCHGPQGGGVVGPNLTDRYWIHGGRPTDHYDVIMNGVLEKGMAAWGRQLGPVRVQDLVAYVITLRNTNAPGKPPEGELYVPEEAAPADEGAEAGPDDGAGDGTDS